MFITLPLDPVVSTLQQLPQIRAECHCSFSQSAEDIVISAALGEVTQQGIFVDVGAYHPYRFSNTFALYMQGWRGINIDANPDAIIEFNRYRPDDVNIQALVSDKSEELTYYRFVEGAWNSVNPQTVEILAERNIPIGRLRDSTIVRTTPISEILEEHVKGRKIDLLNIDVEGLDERILRSIDLRKYQPKIICIEMDREQWQGTMESHLRQAGYSFYSQCVNSVIFRHVGREND